MFETSVGITTRNRPNVLHSALEHFSAFHTNEVEYVIVDDNSDDRSINEQIVKDFADSINAKVTYRYSERRLGIAAAKNACLYPLQNYEHVFMFDDDCWPATSGWSQKWAAAAEANSVHHSMFQIAVIPDDSPQYNNAAYKIINTIGEGETAIHGWSNCFGVALHFTKFALESLGGYDTAQAKNVYGYEHAQMSKRAKEAGLTAGLSYPSPAQIENWIYSFDLSYRWRHIDSPLPISWASDFSSSVTPEEAAGYPQNAQMMRGSSIRKPLEDPLAPQVNEPRVDVIIPTKSNDEDLLLLIETLSRDESVGEIVIVADGEQTFTRLQGKLSPQIKLLQVERSIGLHRMWNLGLDTVQPNGRHVAIINDDVSLTVNAMSITCDILGTDHTIGMVTPCDNPDVSDRFIETTGVAGYCMVMAADLVPEWRFDENMKWWYGDNDVMMWVSKTKQRKAGITGSAHATGNRSRTIHEDPPPNFHSDIKNDARIYKEKWG
jgi:glycosyltransferase involved in cell wall biosynthesis